MSVLHVRSTVSFKVKHTVPSEHDWFARIHVYKRITHSAQTHKVSDFAFLFLVKHWGTLRNFFVSPFNCFVKDLIKSDVVSSAAAHLVAWQRNEVVGEMHEIVGFFAVA